jgi:ankyrin repeat protein
LVEGGVDIGLRSKVGTTAMLIAKYGGNADIISYLAHTAGNHDGGMGQKRQPSHAGDS